MFKTSALGLLLVGLTSLPALAGDCGRWVPCGPDASLEIDQTRSYVYGETRDVEPWIADETETKPEMKAPAAQRPALGASPAAQQVRLIENVADSSEDTATEAEAVDPEVFPEDDVSVIDLTPEEEAAMRAYLAEIDKERGTQSAFSVGAKELPTQLGNVRVLDVDED